MVSGGGEDASGEGVCRMIRKSEIILEKYTSLQDAIKDRYGESRSIARRQHVSGGDINEAEALTLDDGSVLFMKSNSEACLRNFEAEAKGLRAIQDTGTIGCATVLGLGTEGNRSFLLLEFISEGVRIKDFWETFAWELSSMHHADVGDRYGFGQDNWIGSRKQENRISDSWVAFFRDYRLKPQFRAANSYFSEADWKKADWLLEHLDRYLTEPARPSLVHGDLWAGNLITGSDGKGWLIDPAVYWGHPEVDIAMTELFGGFAFEFYNTYKETGLLDAGYAERRDLYNLYQLLNHLNMFGTGYLGSVRRILARYVG